MGEIAKWAGHSFTTTPKLIRSFSKLTVKGASSTEDKTASNQTYVSRKAGNAIQVTLTAELYAATGANVYKEAMDFVNEARAGAKGYLYIAGSKAFTPQLMLTDASVDEVEIAPNGKWVSCNVKLTLKEAEETNDSGGGSGDSSGSGGSSGGGGSSKSKKATVKKITAFGAVGVVAGAAVAIAESASTVKKAAQKAKDIENKAAAASKPAAPKPVVKPAKSTKFKTVLKK